MRLIESHKVNPANDQLTVGVLDGPGPGGANHQYIISQPSGPDTYISFQNGPINEVGVNGLTHEALLAILIDRMTAFQAGPYACPENADALAALIEAQGAMHSRTRARMARGVEGTHAH